MNSMSQKVHILLMQARVSHDHSQVLVVHKSALDLIFIPQGHRGIMQPDTVPVVEGSTSDEALEDVPRR
jgi:hypothetical protein